VKVAYGYWFLLLGLLGRMLLNLSLYIFFLYIDRILFIINHFCLSMLRSISW
jgi:hypothetical protein